MVENSKEGEAAEAVVAKGETTQTRAAFIAILGAPNAGKSTLINALVGEKISIVSDKVQTTRFPVRGIAQVAETQLVFIDTPGIFAPQRRLDRAMVGAALRGAMDADACLLVIDAVRCKARGRPDPESRTILERLKAQGIRFTAVLNKTDALRPAMLLPLAQAMDDTGLCEQIFMVSAKTGEGVPDLLRALVARAPFGPWHYPPDQLSDQNNRLLSAEVTREQLYHQLKQELPYAATVETEKYEERQDGSVAIWQSIVVLRDGQKGIVVGKGGARLKAIGQAARLALSQILDCRVHLYLHVKVTEGWDEAREYYDELGLEYDEKA